MSIQKNDSDILCDRIFLKKQVSENFIETINMRYKAAIDVMNINVENLKVIYCNSINKHTCLLEKNKTLYLVFDEHHSNMLGALNILYYTYGNIDFKQVFYELVLKLNDYFKNRLSSTILILLTEKNIINNKLSKAHLLASIIKEYEFSLDNTDEEDSFFLNLYLIKSRKTFDMQIFSLNFYVFHELSHVKYKQDKSVFRKISKVLKNNISTNMQIFEKLNTNKYTTFYAEEECICDIYALIKLLEFTSKNAGDSFLFEIVESYITSTLNIVLMGSIYESSIHKYEDTFVSAYLRIITVVNTFLELLLENNSNFSFKKVQNHMNYTREKFANFKSIFDEQVLYFEELCKTNKTEYAFQTEEWKHAFNEAIEILSLLN